DAIRTLLRFAFDELNLHRVVLDVDERNERAIAAYKKCGFVEEGRLRDDRYAGGRYWATVVMGVMAEEFRALTCKTATTSSRDRRRRRTRRTGACLATSSFTEGWRWRRRRSGCRCSSWPAGPAG